MIIKNLREGNSQPISGPSVSTILDTPSTKEIRIEFAKNDFLKKHQTPFPIIIEVFEGEIHFTVENETYNLERGHILTLEPKVPHSLLAKKESIVRLTLSKKDTAERVQKINEN